MAGVTDEQQTARPEDAGPAASPAPPPDDAAPAAPDTAGTGEARARRPLFRRRTRPIDAGGGAGAEAAPEPTGRIPSPAESTGVIARVEPPAADAPVEPPPLAGGGARLRRERRRLMAEREERIFHLGGLAFELYRRGLLTEGVARRRAGVIAELDEAVRTIDDRLRELDERRDARRGRAPAPAPVARAAGCCLVCRAEFPDAARFCMQCGARLVPDPPSPAVRPSDTAVLPAAPA